MVNDLRGRRVGLIGANGFIGSAILKALIQSGLAPLALCGPSVNSRPIPAGIESLVCDLTDPSELNSMLSGLEVLIHSAGPPSVKHSFERPEDYIRVHTQGTATVTRACIEAKVDRLVYISSAEVYGRPEVNPVPEIHRLQARSPYAAAKIGAERIIEAYAVSLALKAIILRPFSIYGPDPTPYSLLNNIITMARCGTVRVQDLRPVRDYCYVGDLADAVLLACYMSTEKLKIFNVGTGKGTSVADFAALVLRSMGSSLPVLEDRSHARPVQSEIFELVADNSRARNELGWDPKVNLEEGLRHVLAVHKSNA